MLRRKIKAITDCIVWCTANFVLQKIRVMQVWICFISVFLPSLFGFRKISSIICCWCASKQHYPHWPFFSIFTRSLQVWRRRYHTRNVLIWCCTWDLHASNCHKIRVMVSRLQKAEGFFLQNKKILLYIVQCATWYFFLWWVSGFLCMYNILSWLDSHSSIKRR
jgi:hypothetical protein